MLEHRITITGHTNIENCFGAKISAGGRRYDPTALSKALELATAFIQLVKRKAQADVVFNIGMARGWDEIIGLAAVTNGCKVDLYVPSSVRWHQNRGPSRGIRAQAVQYQKLLDHPNTRHIFEVPKRYNGHTFQFVNFSRNAAMVDNASDVVSFKFYNSTGTNDAIHRALLSGLYRGNGPDLVETSVLKLSDPVSELVAAVGVKLFQTAKKTPTFRLTPPSRR